MLVATNQNLGQDLLIFFLAFKTASPSQCKILATLLVTPLLNYIYYALTPLLNYRYYSQARNQNFAMEVRLLQGSGGGAPSARKFCIFCKNNQILGLI